MKLKRLKELHQSALEVEEIAEALFWVRYPGLVLLVSVRHLIGFWSHGEWRIIEGFDIDSTKARHELFLKAFLPGPLIVYSTRVALVADLKHQINSDECTRIEQVS